jgi:hypothetical protein
MPPVIVDQPWPPDVGEDLRRPDGTHVIDPQNNRPLRVYHNQIIVWAKFTAGPKIKPGGGATLFPILIDAGFNESFLMQERQAEAWMSPAVFATFNKSGNRCKLGREILPLWDIALWLYPNVPGTRDPDPSGAPVWLDLPHGVPLTPPGSAYTKEKPLLGLRAVRFNRLALRIDGAAQRVCLDTP